MKIKAGDRIFNIEDEPIMLIFETEKEPAWLANRILTMEEDWTKLAIFRTGMSDDEVDKFMKI